MKHRLVVVLLTAIALGCDSASTPFQPTTSSPATLPAPSPTPPSSPTSIRFHVSGVVTDETGSPITDATIQVDYAQGSGGFSSPSSHCPLRDGYCWLATKTNGAGFYDVTFDGRIAAVHGKPGTAAMIAAWGEGYEHDFQILPTGTTDIAQNLRMRRVRTIDVGQQTTLSVEPDSSLCTDREDLFALSSRCETVTVSVGAPGTLVVEARAAAGGVVPTMYWATTGNYSGMPVRSGPGTLSIPVRNGSFQILVGVPVGMSSQQFDVLTSLR